MRRYYNSYRRRPVNESIDVETLNAELLTSDILTCIDAVNDSLLDPEIIEKITRYLSVLNNEIINTVCPEDSEDETADIVINNPEVEVESYNYRHRKPRHYRYY